MKLASSVCGDQAPASAERRDRIVDAATRLFAERPYGQVHMSDVAHAAGVAKPTLYRYFATKEGLFLEVLEDMMGDLVNRVAQARDTAAGRPLTAIAQAIGEILGVMGRCAALVKAVDENGQGLDDRGRAIIRRHARRLRAALAGVVADGIAKGVFSPVDPALAAGAIVGAARMVAAGLRENAGDPATAASGLVGLLVRGLAAPGVLG